MPISTLDALVVGNRDWTVHVYVSRLWQHRGASDDGPIKHTDIVFQDIQANYMYGEIAAPLVNQFIERLEEGKIYELSRFVVSKMKNWYKPVDCDRMIRFGRYTVVKEIDNNLMDYPLCTYALTPLDELPSPTDNPASFIDVAGIVTGVSSISVYHSAARSVPSTKRIIYLSDLSGFEITVCLWGERAHAFDGESVLQIGQGKPVAVVFVGTLVKPFEGRRALSGSAPCRWYINNEDLPEIAEMLTQLKDRLPAIRGIDLPGQSAAEISSQVDLQTKTVAELRGLDIWNNKKTRFYCTVVLTRLKPNERWWFHACTACGGGTNLYGAVYKCPAKDCGSTGGAPRYKICYVGSDGTGEIDLIFFEKAGRELIGKPPLTIMQSKVPSGMSVEDAIQFARTDQSTPRELASAVSRKFRLVVSVTTKSFQPLVFVPSYQVVRIEEQHGRQPRSAALGRKPGLLLSSASPSTSSGSGGLSSAGHALATDLGLTQSNSSENIAALPDAPPSNETPDSTVDSDAIPPHTPPSVTKPAKPSDANTDSNSSIKKALFQGDPTEFELGTAEAVLPSAESEKVHLPDAVDPDSAPTLPTASAKKPPPKRSQPAKTQADGAGKKQKAGKN